MNQPDQHSAPQAANAPNGILAKFSGEYIGRVCLTLPNPASVTAEEMTVEVEADWAGRVKLTFSKHRHRRAKAKTMLVI